MDPNVSRFLKDLNQWINRFSDILDPDGLAAAQLKDADEVWVYAPHPLELQPTNLKLRTTVFKNISNGVRYIYFVESEDGAKRIQQLLSDVLEENGVPSDSETSAQQMLEHVTVVVLRSCNFLTYYTVHKTKHHGPIVFQSEIKNDRRDLLAKLDDIPASHIMSCLKGWFDRTEESAEGKIVVRRLAQ